MTEPKIYLGDSVYASFDGNCVILTTENGYEDDPMLFTNPGTSNLIVLEPQTWAQLKDWMEGKKGSTVLQPVKCPACSWRGPVQDCVPHCPRCLTVVKKDSQP